MRCHEARQFLGPYLDSELDAKTTQEIETHLESCPDCARVFASEELLDGRIFTALRQGSHSPEVWRQIERRIKPRRLFGLDRRLALRLLPVAAAACLIALAILFWPKQPSLELAIAAAKHHDAYMDQVMMPEFTGAVPDEIARELDSKLDVAAFSYLPSEHAFTSSGARLCHISGTPIAWIFGRYKDAPVSLLVFKKDELSHFPLTKQKLDTGESVVCSKTGRYQFAVRLVGDHVVCVIGSASMAELERLVKSVSKPT
jgi:anti-sigma factor RsiW